MDVVSKKARIKKAGEQVAVAMLKGINVFNKNNITLELITMQVAISHPTKRP